MTFPPFQIVVIVVTPTPDEQQLMELNQVASVPTLAPVTAVLQPTVTLQPTPIAAQSGVARIDRPNHHLGWAWSEQLIFDEDRDVVVVSGLSLYDKPAKDARRIGLVMGLADVTVAGRSYCDYTPILVYEDYLLSVVLPKPDIVEPEPLAASVSATATPPGQVSAALLNTTVGWVVSDRLTITGEAAISGQFSLNLRADPCRSAENLGLVPAGAPMFVIGAPQGEYTLVRVNNDLLMPPFEGIHGN